MEHRKQGDIDDLLEIYYIPEEVNLSEIKALQEKLEQYYQESLKDLGHTKEVNEKA